MRNTRTTLTADLAKRSLASLGLSRACDVRNFRSYVVLSWSFRKGGALVSIAQKVCRKGRRVLTSGNLSVPVVVGF